MYLGFENADIIHTISLSKVKAGSYSTCICLVDTLTSYDGTWEPPFEVAFFLGAAAGSPYIVFKLTFSYGFMLRIYIYI